MRDYWVPIALEAFDWFGCIMDWICLAWIGLIGSQTTSGALPGLLLPAGSHGEASRTLARRFRGGSHGCRCQLDGQNRRAA